MYPPASQVKKKAPLLGIAGNSPAHRIRGLYSTLSLGDNALIGYRPLGRLKSGG
jgi:hypothetical protein